MSASQNSSQRRDDVACRHRPPRPIARDYIADKFIEFSSPAPDAALCGIANAHAPQRNVAFTGAPSCCFWFRYLRVSRHTD
jgi:hypothetical protein